MIEKGTLTVMTFFFDDFPSQISILWVAAAAVVADALGTG